MRGKGTGRARKGHILERNTETMDHLDGGSSCGERGAGLGPRKVLRGCTHPAALNSCRRRGLVVPKVQPHESQSGVLGWTVHPKRHK